MSSSRGRSWRPEKKIAKRDSRRVLIYLAGIVLAGLVGTVLVLIYGHGVPLLHFVVVTEHSFRGDETAWTPPPTGATAWNAARLAEVFEQCREANDQQIGEGVTLPSVNKLINGNSLLAGKRLFVYCAADAWCVPDNEHSDECVLEILPANVSRQQQPVRFSKLLSNLKEANCPQILLALEFTGRVPGLASGAVADDIPSQVRREVKRAKVPGLTVICSHDRGERNWEYVPGFHAASSANGGIQELPEPAFHGTAFGHFLRQAVITGRAGTAAELQEVLKKNVGEWVDQQFGERQSVWMVSTNPADAGKELLTLARLPRETQPFADLANAAAAVADAVTSKASSESKLKADVEQKDETLAKDPNADDRPMAKLKRLLVQRDALRDHTVTPVLYPSEWLQLRTNLLAAERFAMSGNDPEFNSLHDDVLKTALKDLERKAIEFSQSPKQRDIDDWIAVDSSESLSDDDIRLLKRTQLDFSVEPDKAPLSLPDAIDERRGLRQAFVHQLTRDLKQVSKSIADESPEAQSRLIQDRLFLLQNLSSRWAGNIIPDEWSTVQEVLRGDNKIWLASVMKPLVRLVDLRRQSLRFAAGKDADGKPLRQNEWRRIYQDIDELLKDLHSAERWLCVGPEGKTLAEDRLNKVEQSLTLIKDRVSLSNRLTRIKDAQRFQIPFIIQYMAFRLEEIAAAKVMATHAIDGSVTAIDFPVGQLNPLELSPEHIEAMFALTRDFSKPQSEVTEVDEKHMAVLERFISTRLGDAAPAHEAWELLNTPLVPDRQKQYQSLLQPRSSRHQNALEAAGRSGVWTSFWSLRLVDAVGQKSNPSDWQKWSELVATVADPEQTSIVSGKRAVMAELLRRRWIDAITGLKRIQTSDVFAPEHERLDLLTKDLIRRVRAVSPENRSLYSRIQDTLSDRPPQTETAAITVLNPNAELASDYSVTTNLRVSHAAQLYVLNNDISLKNAAFQADRNWLSLPLNGSGESEIALEIGLKNTPQTPTTLMIVVVDHEGAPVKQVTTTVQPPAENTWEISVAQVEEGNPDPRPITLEEIDGRTNRRLRLLPSTLDSATRMDAPTQLKLRLHRIKGISKSVRIRALLSDGKTEVWKLAEPLVFPDNVAVVDIPFSQPLPEGAANPGTAALPEITRGLIFEITPDDLQRKITSQFRITPKLLGPEDIVETPNPSYAANDELTISMNRAPFDNSNVLWPRKLVAEVELSPKLQRYLLPGTNLKTLDATGFTFQIPFSSDIRKVLSEDGLEFGVSVGGIPHGWWWTLTDGTARLLEGNQPQIRTFLSVDNPLEIQPIANSPDLLLGKGWEKAKMTARVFIHGGSIGHDCSMRVYFQRQDTEASIRATETPFKVNSRYSETVRIAPGENGTWLFSTTTNPYMVSDFTPVTFGLQNGIYGFNAVLEQRGLNAAPTSSSVDFILDSTAPELNADNVQLSQPKTNFKGVLKGSVKVVDRESGIRAVRVGLNAEMMVPLAISPGKEVNVQFALDSSRGFPKLEQKEQDEEATGTLIVEADNGADGTSSVKRTVTFIRPGKEAPMAKLPGTIVVKFKIESPFNVTVSGNGIIKDAKNSAGSATIADLPPGTYTVTWKPVQGTAGAGQESVSVGSGKTVTVGPGK